MADLRLPAATSAIYATTPAPTLTSGIALPIGRAAPLSPSASRTIPAELSDIPALTVSLGSMRIQTNQTSTQGLALGRRHQAEEIERRRMDRFLAALCGGDSDELNKFFNGARAANQCKARGRQIVRRLQEQHGSAWKAYWRINVDYERILRIFPDIFPKKKIETVRLVNEENRENEEVHEHDEDGGTDSSSCTSDSEDDSRAHTDTDSENDEK